MSGSGDGIEKKSPFLGHASSRHHEQRRLSAHSHEDDAPPFFWARWIARKPKLCFGLSLGIQVGFVVVTILLFRVGYDILPAVFEDLPIDSDSEPMYLRQQAWKHRFDDFTQKDPERAGREARSLDALVEESNDGFKVYMEAASTPPPPRPLSVLSHLSGDSYEEMAKHQDEMMLSSMACFPDNDDCKHKDKTSHRSKRDVTDEQYVHRRELHLGSLTLMYEVPEGENIFTKHNLQKIAQLEYDLYMRDDFQFHFCKLSLIAGALNCEQFISVLRLFDGSFSGFSDELFDPSFTNISNVLAHALASESTEDLARSFFSKDALINMEAKKFVSRRTRSTMSFGFPLKEFGNQTNNRLEQRKVLRRWLRETIVPVLKNSIEEGVGDAQFSYFSPALYFDEALVAIKVDWMLIFGAIMFNFFFMWFQTGSLWITSFGVFSIITSFIGANLVYRVVFGYRYFGYFNILALFILLGIGADDIFIFTDTWKISQLKSHSQPLEQRISAVFKRAVVAMFVTSLTTMTAFFVSSFSPLLPIAGFGTFSGLAVFINYTSVITFLPCVVVMHHKYLENCSCCCCCCNKDTSVGKDQSPVIRRSLAMRFNILVIGFFKRRFFYFVTHRVVRVVILVLFAGMLGAGIYACTTIQLDNETFRLFNKWHSAEIAKKKLRYEFMSNSQEAKVTVNLVWGLGPQDRTMCPRKEYNGLYPCEGHTVWDDSFSLTDPQAQIALYDFCTELKQSNRSELQLSRKGQQNNITCFIHDMMDFFKEESKKPQYPEGTDFELPFTKEKMQTLMKANSQLFRNDSYKKIDHPFELAVEWWLTDGFSNETIKDKRWQFAPYLGLKKTDDRNLAWSNGKRLVTYMNHWHYPEIYNKRLMFVSIQAVTAVSEWSIGLSDGLELIRSWETYMESQSSKWPSSLRRAWQFSPTFVWLRVIENLSSQAITAVGIGLVLAFVVICMGTSNLLTALWASVLLASVPVCVLGLIPLAGWRFGLPEALNLCLIVGLAVDYIVHMAEGYHMSPRHSRHERLQDALESVGISIMAGAITTLGASLFMMMPKLLFFKQFGAFVFTTISLSAVFSLFVFPAGFSIFGPQGNFGSFLNICTKSDRTERDEAIEEKDVFIGAQDNTHHPDSSHHPDNTHQPIRVTAIL